jgi:hypothetical protein
MQPLKGRRGQLRAPQLKFTFALRKQTLGVVDKG